MQPPNIKCSGHGIERNSHLLWHIARLFPCLQTPFLLPAQENVPLWVLVGRCVRFGAFVLVPSLENPLLASQPSALRPGPHVHTQSCALSLHSRASIRRHWFNSVQWESCHVLSSVRMLSPASFFQALFSSFHFVWFGFVFHGTSGGHTV